MTIGTDTNDFVVQATATIMVPTAGAWTFGVNSDDGFSFQVIGATFTSITNGNPNPPNPGTGVGTDTMEYDAPRGAGNTLGTINFAQAGTYNVRLVYYERAGGAEVELFAAPGSYTAFNNNFRLVGDVAHGGLSAGHSGGTTVNSLAEAQNVISNWQSQWWSLTATAPAVNFVNILGPDTNRFSGDLTFPGLTMGVQANDFVTEAKSQIYIAPPGVDGIDYTFGVSSDDGYQLTITTLDGQPVLFFCATPRIGAKRPRSRTLTSRPAAPLTSTWCTSSTTALPRRSCTPP